MSLLFHGFNVLQVFSAVFICVSILMLLHLYFNKIETKEATILILIWLVHALTFYILVFLNDFGFEFMQDRTWTFTSWSSALRFHSFLTVMSYLLMRLLRHRLFNKILKPGE
jgi:hypothetical protein